MASNSPTDSQAKRTNIRAPKVGHKKSRKGCQTCKARRVKCDEAYPVCGICHRLGLDCTYTQPEPARARSKSTNVAASSSTLSPGRASSQGSSIGFGSSYAESDASQAHRPGASDAGAAESRERRYMELRLLHHWMINVSRPFGLTAPPMWKELWHGEVPHVALENENALFAMFAMSATHLLGTYPNDDSILQARQNYWVWALREQRNAVSTLDLDDMNVNAAKTDAVAYAALLITMNALAMLQERSLEPYAPPMDWLEVGRGAFTVLPPYEKVTDGSGLKVLMDITAPIWSANIQLDFETQRDFGAILSRDIASIDVWDRDTCESYESALSYIGSFRRNLLMGQTADVSLRWICMFPFMVPRMFIDFIGEQRPRALVVLAHFFAVVARTDALKYLGNTGELTTAHKEVYAIRKKLPAAWQGLMVWPLGEIGAT